MIFKGLDGTVGHRAADLVMEAHDQIAGAPVYDAVDGGVMRHLFVAALNIIIFVLNFALAFAFRQVLPALPSCRTNALRISALMSVSVGR